ncbi:MULTISPECIES: AMP-binding protein [Ramlibacter]|uniref:AMP-binding protein n=1 Tax=Ramlibacter pinisoli TaxID=2682844 RepID=A0A6N8IPT8_9BURK|nr:MULTISPECIES: AMP-binding protein [Ramlibacter]MBA2963933.1 acyl--CoA ligase [Ramlibacter sp. CGMCC 1.13660]MVQ28899.1 AMP-binding protein [Ramlibacter pinisoli]
MTAHQCTAAQVGAVAAAEPQRLAIHDEHGPVSYGTFHHRVLRCAQRLAALGVRPGDRVAVGGPGIARQLVALLAAEGLGAVTASFGASGDAGAATVFRHVQWVLAGERQEVPAGVRLVPVDAAFLQALDQPLEGPPPPWVETPPEAPQRMGRTSGSTGEPKILQHTRAGQEWWIDLVLGEGAGVRGRGTRLLLLAPLVVGGAFPRAAACLRAGAAIVGGSHLDLAVLRPTALYGLPAHLDALLAAMPPDTRLPWRVESEVVGGVLPAWLRQRAEAVLGARPRSLYGCGEAGPVCDDMDEDGTGTLCPGADVRILDDDGHALPAGAQGTVAVRTPALVGGYLQRPQETARAFRDGWYVSNDVGQLVAPRRLRLLGRRDDLLSVGGLKIGAAVLEERLARLPSLAAAAALSVQLDGGRTTLGIAVVLRPGRSVAEAQAELEPALADVAALGIRLLTVDALPRLPGGKLDRAALLRLFLQAGARASPCS